MKKEEKEVLDDLVNAWNKFVKLDKEHPEEINDFADGIHKCQYVLAMRIARQVEPSIFIKK